MPETNYPMLYVDSPDECRSDSFPNARRKICPRIKQPAKPLPQPLTLYLVQHFLAPRNCVQPQKAPAWGDVAVRDLFPRTRLRDFCAPRKRRYRYIWRIFPHRNDGETSSWEPGGYYNTRVICNGKDQFTEKGAQKQEMNTNKNLGPVGFAGLWECLRACLGARHRIFPLEGPKCISFLCPISRSGQIPHKMMWG